MRPMRSSLGRALSGRNLGLFITLVIALAYLGVQAQDYLTSANIKVISLEMTPTAIVGITTALLIISGYVDLSIGSLFGLGAVSSAVMARHLGPLGAMLFGVAVCGVVGLINGILVWTIKMSPIIITLGSLTVIHAFVLVVTAGEGVASVPPSFERFGQATPFGISTSVYVMIGLALIAGFVLNRTTTGRHLFAIGGNREASIVAGVKVRKLVLWTFFINGACAGLAGYLSASRFGSADPTFGVGSELTVITAVVLGGVAFTGGEGTIFGVLLASALLTVISSGVIALGLNPNYGDVVSGSALVIAVGIDQLTHSQRERYRKMLAMRERDRGDPANPAPAAATEGAAAADRRDYVT